MSRTNRIIPEWRHPFKKPKTTGEIRKNVGLLADVKTNDLEYSISHLNRLHRNIPVHWDDKYVSSLYEDKYHYKYKSKA